MKKFMSIMLAMLLLVATMSLPVMAAGAGTDENTETVEGVEAEIDGGASEGIPGDAVEDEVEDSGETEVSTLFPFRVVLRDVDGNELAGTYKYEGSYAGTLQSGDVVYLGDGESIEILQLPEGTQYEVTELDTDGYALVESTGTTGEIVYDTASHANFVNQEVVFGPQMPNSGGSGVQAFIMGGMGLISIGIALCAVLGIGVYKTRKNVMV